ERASARETAIRTAVGAFCMELLKIFDVKIVNRTISIGNIFDNDEVNMQDDRVLKKIMSSNVFCYDNEKEKDMINAIDDAKQNGDTLGGCCQISAFNIPVGLG
ncbi:MAG TPA: chorismate synthase, partial [Clostridiaceae bacterium]|nr:chorismate synthase [Clostridiaceae bacterium]